MKFTQNKLTKDEWEFLEKPLSANDMILLKFIMNGYQDVNMIYNNNVSLIGYMKITSNDEFHKYFYDKYYKDVIIKLNKKYGITYKKKVNVSKINIKKADKIRIKRLDNSELLMNDRIYENILIKQLKKYLSKKNPKNYYTLYKLIRYKVLHINKYLKEYINYILDDFKDEINIIKLIKKSDSYIEKNELLNNNDDIKLYDHQKRLFNEVKRGNNKLILYQAPTGTGKTISPIGLINEKVVIFTCVAKHVGLQLAKACISLEIPIAVAFGCETPDDIRLHYYAAKDFIKNKRTGGIFRVDNSNGERVKLIITDVQSYLPAMNFVLAFNKREDIVWYWDEPTITLDYTEHKFHVILEKNWKNNMISNIILSSATLPNENEIRPMISYYLNKLKGSVVNVVSYDCKKTVPLINVNGEVVVPHRYYDNYDKFKECVKFLEMNKTVLRYIDLKEASKLIVYVNENFDLRERYKARNYFDSIDMINITNIKLYYLRLCKIMDEEMFNKMKSNTESSNMYKSCIKITTEDSHTLTDGPTIMMTENVDKMGMFYLKASQIPYSELDYILKMIDKNMEYKMELDKLMDDEKQRLAKIDIKIQDKCRDNDAEAKLQNIYNKKLEELISRLYKIELNSKYIPNRELHYKTYNGGKVPDNIFTSDVNDEYVEKIMALEVNKEWKILLLMGIGVFTKEADVKYLDIMKKLAEEQKLYLIIASTDYIYGTNYQFCHGYLCKDLMNMTQEKMIQALGRVGRKEIKNMFTVRLRNNDLIDKLFRQEKDKIEVRNMNRLFSD